MVVSFSLHNVFVWECDLEQIYSYLFPAQLVIAYSFAWAGCSASLAGISDAASEQPAATDTVMPTFGPLS